MDVVNKLVEQVEDEWKQTSMRRPHGGGGPGGNDGGRGIGGGGDRGGHDRRGGGGGDSYRGSNVNPLIAAQMQHIAVQRLQHSAPNMGPLGRGEGPPQALDEDKRTIEHIASQLEARRQWEAVSVSSQTLNGSGASPPFSYKEGENHVMSFHDNSNLSVVPNSFDMLEYSATRFDRYTALSFTL